MHEIKNHNSLGCEQPSGLRMNSQPITGCVFWPITGLISCAGVTGRVGMHYTSHTHNTEAGLRPSCACTPSCAAGHERREEGEGGGRKEREEGEGGGRGRREGEEGGGRGTVRLT